MKVHVPKKQLAETLGHVERVVPARSANPGLSLIRMQLEDGSLRFSGSNMEIDIEARIAAEVDGEGQAAVPAQVFGQVVRALPGELVELTFAQGEMEISSGSYATRLQLSDASQAPQLAFPDSYAGELEAAELQQALAAVRYATAVAEYQAIFRGVKLELADGRTRAVATDGFRLAYFHSEASSGIEADLVVPSRSVDELTRLLGDGGARLELGEGQLSVASGPYRLNLKLMEGSFPDYQRIIPTRFPLVFTTRASALSEAVARVALMSDKTTNNRVDLFVKDGVLQITAEGSYGRSQEALEVQQEGEDPEIAVAYNSKYLVDALGPLSGDLRVALSGRTSPTVMSDPADSRYLAMVVPLRTG